MLSKLIKNIQIFLEFLIITWGLKFKNELFQVADQSGKLLKLPDEEKKALSVALALHEKGRAAMKRKDLSLALMLYLEADRQFRYV